MSKLIRLYRPVGLREWELIVQSNRRAFPPRLPEQPIFYPVLNQPYAEQIARDWNTKTPYYIGIVTRFDLNAEYATRFERQVVGNQTHEEMWVPAEELTEFNQHIVGQIEALVGFIGSGYSGPDPKTLGILDVRSVDVA